MSGWRSGDVLAVAAGLVMLTAAATPWVRAATGAEGYALAIGGDGLFAFTLLSALTVLVTGLARTSWTALAALLAAFIAAFVVFTAAILAHAPGAHPGFGLFALSAGAVLSMIAAVLNAIEREGRRL